MTPKASREQVVAAARRMWETVSKEPFPDMCLVGVRGYYRDTLGKPGVNDRGIYDDAIFVLGPEGMWPFAANTDPSAYRMGVASLLPGVHKYKPGLHGLSRRNPYPAFRPATPGEELPVKRDGENIVPSPRPGVAINIHRGGNNTTSSLGCQTIAPHLWDLFYATVRRAMLDVNAKTFYYILIEGPIN